MRRIVAAAVTVLIFVPGMSFAQGNSQSAFITLLTQIVTLQKQLATTLYNEVAALEKQLSSLAKTKGVYRCSTVKPPICTGTLIAVRDSHNCVTAYQCPSTTSTNTDYTYTNFNTNVAADTCVTPWGNRTAKQGELVPEEPYFTGGVLTGALQVPQRRCDNGQWIPTSQMVTTGVKCTLGGVEFANGVGINQCTYMFLSTGSAACAGGTGIVANPPGYFCRNGSWKYEQ